MTEAAKFKSELALTTTGIQYSQYATSVYRRL